MEKEIKDRIKFLKEEWQRYENSYNGLITPTYGSGAVEYYNSIKYRVEELERLLKQISPNPIQSIH